MNNGPAISVVVPTLNEEKYIGRLLGSLSKQTFKDFEIVISDCASQDSTREIAKRYPKVRIVIEKKKGISAGRNAGARVALGKRRKRSLKKQGFMESGNFLKKRWKSFPRFRASAPRQPKRFLRRPRKPWRKKT